MLCAASSRRARGTVTAGCGFDGTGRGDAWVTTGTPRRRRLWHARAAATRARSHKPGAAAAPGRRRRRRPQAQGGLLASGSGAEGAADAAAGGGGAAAGGGSTAEGAGAALGARGSVGELTPVITGATGGGGTGGATAGALRCRRVMPAKSRDVVGVAFKLSIISLRSLFFRFRAMRRVDLTF